MDDLSAMVMSATLSGNLSRQGSPWRVLSVRPSPRSTRIVLLLTLLVLANFIDLLLTLSQRTNEMFTEINPLASSILHSPTLLIAYKILLVGAACGIILRLRRTRLAEAACWCACGAYLLLLGNWYLYFQIV